MLNLDTHILIYALAGRLKATEEKLLRTQDWCIADIVLWEIAMLNRLGRIALDMAALDFVSVIRDLRVFPITLAIARQSTDLDFRGDPAGEIIAATSIVHGIPLLTRDRHIRKSKIVPLAG